MEVECARDCCKVHICFNSPLSYTGRRDSYIILLFSYSIRFILVSSCEILGRTKKYSYFRTFSEKELCPTEKKKIWPFEEEEWVRISKFLHSATFVTAFLTVRLGHNADMYDTNYDWIMNEIYLRVLIFASLLQRYFQCILVSVAGIWFYLLYKTSGIGQEFHISTGLGFTGPVCILLKSVSQHVLLLNELQVMQIPTNIIGENQ